MARFMVTVRDFLDLVRKNSFKSKDGEELMTEFCGYVNDPQVWSHAEKVAPEFRMTWEENFTEQSKNPADYTCLTYVLKRLHRLPRQSEDCILTTEQAGGLLPDVEQRAYRRSGHDQAEVQELCVQSPHRRQPECKGRTGRSGTRAGDRESHGQNVEHERHRIPLSDLSPAPDVRPNIRQPRLTGQHLNHYDLAL